MQSDGSVKTSCFAKLDKLFCFTRGVDNPIPGRYAPKPDLVKPATLICVRYISGNTKEQQLEVSALIRLSWRRKPLS